jgi:CheY-like chemotaxis protein/anti-sigma regulatory factor (Ser/Thr protein kinase)
MSIAGDAPRQVFGDAVRIKQVILNLVNNAIKFTSTGGIVFALARAPGGATQFTISDSGSGIAPADRARLFQRFEQADGPQRQSGSGLGLAICRELTTRMGGEILLESAPGKGSTFRVIVPLQEALAEAAAEKAPGAGSQVARRILLVEDDVTVAAVIVGLLRASGHHPRHVDNALAALGELALAEYDVALIDLELPGLDGLALARMIRAREAGEMRLPMIGISARSLGDEETLCRQAGMDAFMRKPVSVADLESAVRRMTDEPALRA